MSLGQIATLIMWIPCAVLVLLAEHVYLIRHEARVGMPITTRLKNFGLSKNALDYGALGNLILVSLLMVGAVLRVPGHFILSLLIFLFFQFFGLHFLDNPSAEIRRREQFEFQLMTFLPLVAIALLEPSGHESMYGVSLFSGFFAFVLGGIFLGVPPYGWSRDSGWILRFAFFSWCFVVSKDFVFPPNGITLVPFVFSAAIYLLHSVLARYVGFFTFSNRQELFRNYFFPWAVLVVLVAFAVKLGLEVYT